MPTRTGRRSLDAPCLFLRGLPAGGKSLRRHPLPDVLAVVLRVVACHV